MTTQATAPEQEVLAEAMRIVRGETIMLPSRKHLKALAELNKELLEALRALHRQHARWAGFMERNGDDTITLAKAAHAIAKVTGEKL